MRSWSVLCKHFSDLLKWPSAISHGILECIPLILEDPNLDISLNMEELITTVHKPKIKGAVGVDGILREVYKYVWKNYAIDFISGYKFSLYL